MNSQKLLILIISTLAAFGLGYAFADNSSQVRALQSELARLKSLQQRSNQNDRLETAQKEFHKSVALKEAFVETQHPTNAATLLDKWELRKRRIDERRKQFVAKTSLELSNEYTKVFGDLGLSPAKASVFRQKLAVIHSHALETEQAFSDLVSSRQMFESEIHSALGDDGFSKYKAYELAKPAEREYQLLGDYLRARGDAPIDSSYKNAVVSMIKDAQAYTVESWSGPFEGVPQPAVGDDMTIQHFQNMISQVSSSLNSITQQSASGNLPPDIRQSLTDYYTSRLNELTTGLQGATDFARMTPDQRKQWAIAQMRKSQSSSNP